MIDFKETLGCGKCFGRIMLSVASRGLFITLELKCKDSEKFGETEQRTGNN